MTAWLKGYVLYGIVFVIALLLLGDIYLIYKNNLIITSNKNLQEQAEKIKVGTSEVMRSIHLLDLAVRSYAFVPNEHFDSAIQTALRDKNSSLLQLETQLRSQDYHMDKFYRIRDSIESYVNTNITIMDLIKRKQQQDYIE